MDVGAWRFGALVHGVDRSAVETTPGSDAGSACAARHGEGGKEWRFDVNWRASQDDASLPPFIESLAARSGVKEVRWTPNLKS
jgi:hypothetical protein